MPDPEKTMQGLARIAVEHPGCDAVISDAIALIETRLEPEWISVDDRLPEIPSGGGSRYAAVNVLTASPQSRVRELRYAINGYALTERGKRPRWEEPDGGRLAYTQPTHWRPMPTFVKPEKETE